MSPAQDPRRLPASGLAAAHFDTAHRDGVRRVRSHHHGQRRGRPFYSGPLSRPPCSRRRRGSRPRWAAAPSPAPPVPPTAGPRFAADPGGLPGRLARRPRWSGWSRVFPGWSPGAGVGGRHVRCILPGPTAATATPAPPATFLWLSPPRRKRWNQPVETPRPAAPDQRGRLIRAGIQSLYPIGEVGEPFFKRSFDLRPWRSRRLGPDARPVRYDRFRRAQVLVQDLRL